MCYTEGSHTRSWGPSTIWQLHCKDFARGLRCHVLRNKREEAKWVGRKHSMLWIHYCGLRIDTFPTQSLHAVADALWTPSYIFHASVIYFAGDFGAGRGSFPTVTFSWSLPQKSNITYKQALGGWGEGVREEKGREKSSFPAHFTPQQPGGYGKLELWKFVFQATLELCLFCLRNVMYLRNACADNGSRENA